MSKQKSSVQIRNMVLTALFIACGLVLPTVFHPFGGGPVMLPMHLPILICGFVLGWRWGVLCGIILPYLSSFVTGMPPLFPVAVSMSLELAAYGATAGLLSAFTYKIWQQKIMGIYVCLIGAMLVGRVVMGVANAILLGFANRPYSLEIFISGAFVVALPGIIVQLVLVPPLVLIIRKLIGRNGVYEN